MSPSNPNEQPTPFQRAREVFRSLVPALVAELLMWMLIIGVGAGLLFRQRWISVVCLALLVTPVLLVFYRVVSAVFRPTVARWQRTTAVVLIVMLLLAAGLVVILLRGP